MKSTVPASFDTTRETLWGLASVTVAGKKERGELRDAFEELSSQSCGWQIGTVHQWNSSSYYSTLFSAQDGFQVCR
jgi:hypothetical protein